MNNRMSENEYREYSIRSHDRANEKFAYIILGITSAIAIMTCVFVHLTNY